MTIVRPARRASRRIASTFAAAASLALACALLAPGPAAAFPDKAVRFVVPFGPGGATDIVARHLAQRLSETWQQSVLVDNRPGAGGTIGSDLVARAPADGYTLLLATAANAANAALYAKMPHDLLRDFTPVTLVVNVPFVLVTAPRLPTKGLADLLALARAKPAGMTYGTVGLGSSNHLMMELLQRMGKVEMVHVPYKGVGPAITDLLAGRIDMMLFSIGTVQSYLKDGRLRAVALTSGRRSAAMPEVAPIADTLPGYDMTPWYGVLAPAGLPKNVLLKLYADVTRQLKAPDLRDIFLGQGFEPVGSTPHEFAAHLKDSIPRFAKLVKEANIRLDN